MGQIGNHGTAEEIIIRIGKGEKVIMPSWQLKTFIEETERKQLEFKIQVYHPYPQVIILVPLGEKLEIDEEGNFIL